MPSLQLPVLPVVRPLLGALALLATLGAGRLEAQKPTAIPFLKDSLFGFVHAAGKEVTPPRYSDVSFWSDGRFNVRSGKLSGVVDSLGVERVKPQYKSISSYRNGAVAVQNEQGKWALMNPNYTLVTEFAYDRFGAESEGLVTFTSGALSGYMDLSGRVVIPPRFVTAGEFTNGMARVAESGADNTVRTRLVSLIDRTGKAVTKPGVNSRVLVLGPDRILHYDYDAQVKGQDIFVSDREGKVISKLSCAGLAVIETSYTTDPSFPYQCNGKYGFVDVELKTIVEPKYSEADYFFNGVARVTENGKYQFIDRKGSKVFDFTWSVISRYSLPSFNGTPFLIVYDSATKKQGVVDVRGKVVVPVSYDGISAISSLTEFGVFRVKQGEYWGVVDKANKRLVDFKYDAMLDDSYRRGLIKVKQKNVTFFVDLAGKEYR